MRRFWLISIHALFAEGDDRQRRRWTCAPYFYPRPLRRGRRFLCASFSLEYRFLSTPSSQRATNRLSPWWELPDLFLSTPSSQRATGLDRQAGSFHRNFYPRPLRRGRPIQHTITHCCKYFYPRPLRRGRRRSGKDKVGHICISIHALFAEGDQHQSHIRQVARSFLSTPSSQRATSSSSLYGKPMDISIHALFAEGDQADTESDCGRYHFYPRPLRRGRPVRLYGWHKSRTISIHALFAEGDKKWCSTEGVSRYFYPRPLRRGRHRRLRSRR